MCNNGIRSWLLLLALLAGGCGEEASDVSDPGLSPPIDRSRFGDPYQLVGNFNPAEPDLYPILSSDTLTVRLTYPGGCETHRLDLEHDLRGDTAFVWIRHDARNDDCEALIQDEFQAILPERVVERSVVALLHPQGGSPQILSR